MAIPNLPQDVLHEIFLRLPTKSVGRFRCLSRTWNARLSAKQFINSHLSQLKSHQKLEHKLVFVKQGVRSLQILTLPMQSIRTVAPRRKWTYILGSCNGLVLILGTKVESMFVLNPITLEQIQIPFSGKDFPTNKFNQIYGFGHVPSSDDYKAVKLTEHYIPDEHGRRYFLDVYSLRTRVWRRVVNDKGPFDGHKIGAGAETGSVVMPFVNGALHWVVRDSNSRYHIHAFDLASETFHEAQFPREVEHGYLFDHMVLKGCLSIVLGSKINTVYPDLWMMKEYGVMDSWVRFRFDFNLNGLRVVPVCFVEDEKLVCVDDLCRKRWVLCGLKEGMVKKISDGTGPLPILGGTSCSVFVESLVSPEQGNAE